MTVKPTTHRLGLFSLLSVAMQGNHERTIAPSLRVTLSGLKFQSTSYKHKVKPIFYIGLKIQLGCCAGLPRSKIPSRSGSVLRHKLGYFRGLKESLSHC